MNDVIEIKYNNDMNMMPLPKLTGRKMDLFYSILAHTNEANERSLSLINFWDREKRQVEIPINNFIKICRADKWNRSFVEVANEIESFLNLIIDYKIKYETPRAKYAFVCFEEAKWDKFKQTIRVTFQKRFYEMVVNYKLGFTKFELAEFLTISSEYTKRLYVNLKQFRTQGWWLVEWDEFKRLLQIPQELKISDIDKMLNGTPRTKGIIKELTAERTLFDQKRVPFQNLQYHKIQIWNGEKNGKLDYVLNKKRQTPKYALFTFTPEYHNKLGEQPVLDKNIPQEAISNEIHYWLKKLQNIKQTDPDDEETIKDYENRIKELQKKLKQILVANATKTKI